MPDMVVKCHRVLCRLEDDTVAAIMGAAGCEIAAHQPTDVLCTSSWSLLGPLGVLLGTPGGLEPPGSIVEASSRLLAWAS